MADTLIEVLKNESDNNQSKIKKVLTLSIETSVRGGSVALLKNSAVIDSSLGKSEISRSEDVLDAVGNILSKNSIEKTKIKLIVFSRGPGSFTGIRIGVALARGLSKSLDCNCLGLSVLEAMADDLQAEKKVIAAVNFGKNQVCWQLLRTVPRSEKLKINSEIGNLCVSEPRVSQIFSFIQEIESQKFDNLILQHQLYNNLLPSITNSAVVLDSKVIKAGANLAILLGKIAEKTENRHLTDQKRNFEPIYINSLQK